MKKITIQQVIASLRYKNAVSPTQEEISRRQRFLSKFPNQEANILTFQINPTCKCSNDLLLAVQNSSEDKNVLLSYIIGEPVELSVPLNLIGKIITIDDTEEGWFNLTKRLRTDSAMFRNMCIVPSIDDSGNKTLRVFFY